MILCQFEKASFLCLSLNELLRGTIFDRDFFFLCSEYSST
jgi:hypothetical protein